MDIKAYTTRGCKYCTHLKELFDRANVSYDEVIVSDREGDFSMDIFRNEYPKVVGFPFVIIDGEHIGGLVEVAKLFLEKGLVSAKKK
jgi:glutaredoxin